MRCFLYFLLGLFFGGAAQAQTAVQWGLATGANPRTLCVYDTSPTRPCVAVGALDSAAHTFTFNTANVSQITGLGTGVAAALAAPLNATGGLLGYALIGTPQGSYSAPTGLGSAANLNTNAPNYWAGEQTVNELVLGTTGFPNAGGASITAPYHADWTTLTSTLWQNQVQWQIQPNAPSGYAHCSAPGSSGVVILDTGSPFSADMAGRTAFYLADLTATRTVYQVASVQSASQLTLATSCQGPGSMAYFFVTETNDGTVNVNGSTVTLASGQPFIIYTTGIGQWTIGGAAHTCTNITQTTATCDTVGNASNVSYHTDNNDWDTLSLLRIQTGLSEGASASYSGENLAIAARAIGEYDIIAQSNGIGSSWPIFVMSGNYATPGNQYTQIGIYPTGALTLGGRFSYDVVRVVPGAAGVPSNYFYTSMAPSGYAPAWSCRPNTTDAAVGCGIDTYGAGSTIFTSHSFGAIEFAVYGVGGVDHLAVGSSTGLATLYSDGTSTNSNINLAPKGTGTLSVNGSAGVSCPAGTVNLTTFTVVKGLVTHC